jgi:Sel1 repeat
MSRWINSLLLAFLAVSSAAVTEKNPGMAVPVELLRKACDGGEAEDCYNLGVAYKRGETGLAADPAKAAGLFRKACDGGSADACSKLGTMYFQGEGGLPTDPGKAVELFTKACTAGSPKGCAILAAMYEDGLGGFSADPAKAAELYRKACNGGDAEGCADLGALYLNGRVGGAGDLSTRFAGFACLTEGEDPGDADRPGGGERLLQERADREQIPRSGIAKLEGQLVHRVERADRGVDPAGQCDRVESDRVFRKIGAVDRQHNRRARSLRSAVRDTSGMSTSGWGLLWIIGWGWYRNPGSKGSEHLRSRARRDNPPGVDLLMARADYEDGGGMQWSVQVPHVMPATTPQQTTDLQSRFPPSSQGAHEYSVIQEVHACAAGIRKTAARSSMAKTIRSRAVDLFIAFPFTKRWLIKEPPSKKGAESRRRRAGRSLGAVK